MDSFRSKVVDFVLGYQTDTPEQLWELIDDWRFPADAADAWVYDKQYDSPQAEQDEWERVAHIVSTITMGDIIGDAFMENDYETDYAKRRSRRD